MSKPALSAVEARPKVETKEGGYKIASTMLVVGTSERVELKPITEQITAFVRETPIREGMVQISSLHTTAGLILNETQDALMADMAAMFEQVLPRNVYYKHNDPNHSDCERKNADAHLRALVVGHSLTIPIADGQMKLGRWQQVLFAEFDGPNNRQVHVQVMGI